MRIAGYLDPFLACSFSLHPWSLDWSLGSLHHFADIDMPNIVFRRVQAATQIVTRTRPIVRLKRRTVAVESTQASSENAIVSRSLSDVTSPAVDSVLVSLAITEAGRTRAGSKRIVKDTVKDALILGLEALAQSADVFPPLKSVVGGLLFFATQVERVSGNEAQIGETYAEIDAIAASLVRAIPDATVLSPALEAAIRAFAQDVKAVCTEMDAIARQRLVKRFLCAKRHSAQLQILMQRLNHANESFSRTMLTSINITTTEILACVKNTPQKEAYRLTQLQLYFFFVRSQP
ncbi:unnamed protein product [Peniophora sp. CBMAI 1063]|nr:unnamed protein product [Peniophora sp. CBMAI 1063]